MKVKIERLNHTGDGVGYINNKIIFIKKSLPQDIIEVTNIENHKNYLTGDIKNIIKKSPDRQEPLCPYFNSCGGCQLMNMSYNKQLEYKKNKVKDIFKRFSNIDIDPDIIPSNNLFYRNKIVLQVVKGKLGLFQNNNHNLIEIKECLLVPDKINNLIPILKELDLTNITKIMIRTSLDKVMIVFYGNINESIVIEKLKNKVSSLYINDKNIYGNPYIIENLSKYKYKISPKSFFQINKEETINIYNKVLSYTKDSKKIMDLYCGTGSIGIYISNYNNNILGIEINEESIEYANYNKELNNISNINFICGNVGKIIETDKYYDTIIVDPPRSGLDNNTKKAMNIIKPQKIIYVSCNPITLARDIKDLSNNYLLKEITLYDMFPNTHHVESVCALKLK